MAARHREGSSIRNAIQSAKAALRAAEWMPMTAVRVLNGIFFCISGGTKLLVPGQFTLMEQTLAQSHIPFPHANALFVSLVEFVCGAGLALVPHTTRLGIFERHGLDPHDSQPVSSSRVI